jgi:hypothetical protein
MKRKKITGRWWHDPVFDAITRHPHHNSTPVLVLPLDDLDGLVEQAANCDCSFPAVHASRVDFARAVLSSIGVRFPKQRKDTP